MSREIKISYLWQDGDKRIEKIYNLSQIEAGDHYSDMSDCPFLKNYRVIARRQYTGLKDKNGKEIYEGDILDSGFACKYSVNWHKDNCCFVGRGNMGDRYGAYTLKISVGCGADKKKFKEDIEIIGNIYENPELLEAS